MSEHDLGQLGEQPSETPRTCHRSTGWIVGQAGLKLAPQPVQLAAPCRREGCVMWHEGHAECLDRLAALELIGELGEDEGEPEPLAAAEAP